MRGELKSHFNPPFDKRGVATPRCKTAPFVFQKNGIFLKNQADLFFFKLYRKNGIITIKK
ncbi:hypothetical protein C3H53_09110 [Campylobacter jejuni]|nr:hypothetical protein C3H53_09110 [Campylobacter jejuni]RTJ81144.1 hypothetical protein C3H50_09105 [Campylobacter jejuni]